MFFNELPVEQYINNTQCIGCSYNLHHNAGDSINVAIIIIYIRGVGSPIEVLPPRRARSARDFYLLHADGKRRRGSARLLYVRTYVRI